MNREQRAGRTLIGAGVAAAALLGSHAAYADESAAWMFAGVARDPLAEVHTPVGDDPEAQASNEGDEPKPADEPVKTRKRRGLLIGGAIALPIGAILSTIGIVWAATYEDRHSSSSAWDFSIDFDGFGARVFQGVMIGVGGAAMIAGSVMLGVSQIPVAVKPGVAGNPGLTVEAQF
jgi:hypothetical protein